MKLRLFLVLLVTGTPLFSQSNTAADPVFLTKAQKEEIRKKEEAEAAAAKEAADRRRAEEIATAKKAEQDRLEAAKKTERARIEDERAAAEISRIAAKAAAEVKEKEREDASENLRRARVLELGDAREQAAAGKQTIELPAPLGRKGAWRSYSVTGSVLNMAGERIREIAQKKEMTVSEIQEGNPTLGLDELVRVGELVWIWDPRAESLKGPVVVRGQPDNLDRPGRWDVYLVMAGDNAIKIARRHGMTIPELTTGNLAVDFRRLRIGQRVWVWEGEAEPHLFTTYEVLIDDTGTKIAAAHGMTVTDLHAANPGVRWSGLRAGQTLRVWAKSSER